MKTIPFFSSPSESGLRAPITMATKLGCFLWAWGSAGDGEQSIHVEPCIYVQLCSRVRVCTLCVRLGVCVCVCMWGGIVCVSLCGNGLLWFVWCPRAWGACTCMSMWPLGTGIPVCVCTYGRGWLQSQACGFHVHQPGRQ